MPIDAVKTVDDFSLPMPKHSGDPRKLTNVIKKQFSDEIVYPVLSILRSRSGVDVGIFFLHGICSVELETPGKHLVDHDSGSDILTVEAVVVFTQIDRFIKIDSGRILHKDPVESFEQLVFLRGRLEAFHNSDSYVVERIIHLLDHMETVYADLCTWEVNFRDILVELEHIHAYIFDLVTLFLADP